MIDTLRTGLHIWLATTPVDMRRSFDSLAEHVRIFLGADPLGGHLFLFRNRSGERLKILWWDGSGLVLYYKRLARGTFPWPTAAGPRALAISSAELLALLKGSAPSALLAA
jgi:transposase